ncbi:MAG TPA: hypothetical protein H9839_06595, partial [Candidatus Intestinimonas stercorigallinarum]|nr:hypothetical protein [Candidatus Intestinimonas stercorigallinarum]
QMGIHVHIFAQFLGDGGGDGIDDETLHKDIFLSVLLRERPLLGAPTVLLSVSMPQFPFLGKYLFVDSCHNGKAVL